MASSGNQSCIAGGSVVRRPGFTMDAPVSRCGAHWRCRADAPRRRDRQHLARLDLCPARRACARLGAGLGTGAGLAPRSPLPLRSHGGGADAARPLDLARLGVPAWEAYRRAVAAGRSPVAFQEILSDEQRELERVYLALRTDAGLSLASLSRPLPSSTVRWLERGWAEVRDERLVCRPEGWLRLDALVRDLTDRLTTS